MEFGFRVTVHELYRAFDVRVAIDDFFKRFPIVALSCVHELFTPQGLR